MLEALGSYSKPS